MNNPARLWAAALAAAAVPAAVVFGAQRPGINIGLSLLVIVLLFWFFEQRLRHWQWREVPVADVLALTLASISAVSGNPVVMALSLLALGWCCALAVLHRAGWRGAALHPFWLALAPLRALGLVASGTRDAALGAISQLRGERYLPVLRGVLWALPLVLVFFLLLAEADTTLETWRSQLSAALQDLSFLPRLLFWLVMSLLVAGVLAIASRDPVPQREPAVVADVAATRTTTERLIILGSVVVLFAVFLVLQVGTLFGNPGAIAGSGITYAQAVQRGFGQLIVVVSVSAALLLVLDRRALRGAAEGRVRAVSAVLLGQCLLLLLSAWQRLAAYEEAYGWTVQRVCAQLCIIGIALALLVLLRELMLGLLLRRAVQRIGALLLMVVLALCFWNIPAWVVDANLDRAGRGHEVDWKYLVDELSLDAVPALQRQLAGLDTTQRNELSCRLLRQPELRSLLTTPDRWFEWNWRRSQALAAAQRLTREAGEGCAASTGGE
jgi:hypothetical protein